MKLSVVIVTYLSQELIGDCLNSIFRHNDLAEDELEVIVVENSPTLAAEAMAAYLGERFKDRVKVIVNSGNLGYGSGNNLGIKHATGDIVAVMNPDVRLSEPLFKHAVYSFQNHSRLAILGYKQLGNRDLSFYLNPEFRIPVLHTIAERLTNRWNLFLQSWFYLSGAFVFFDKAKFLAVGGYDEKIFLYIEEADITHRLKRAGYRMYYNSSISYHHMIDNRIGFSPEAFKIRMESLKYYFEKYGFNKQKMFRRMLRELKLKRMFASLFRREQQLELLENSIKVMHENWD
jgi:GT2 family glycosyltransferase